MSAGVKCHVLTFVNWSIRFKEVRLEEHIKQIAAKAVFKLMPTRLHHVISDFMYHTFYTQLPDTFRADVLWQLAHKRH